ncbi:uncharacterized protein CTRU02_210904 [Colletotrichum truncatum]|uniref:Uncharacterized protein n=1 Tax=Colletotrichum truncatum TaxID=5467 RepID=A0ACC3YQA1_COLTU|nr:uncharacterized protein CTRU02_03610 [Colletotrichum truncatum]KAF6796632.1 hypothetical protein CTRU02_03610 [Colletotrichum truncatum]
MQLIKIVSIAAAFAPTALARLDPLPTSTDAAQYLSDHAGFATTITGAQATSLVSAVYSVDVKYQNDAKFTTMYSHMWSAAAKASNGPDLVGSMAVGGLDMATMRDENWWKDNVPEKEDKFLADYLSDYQKAANSVLATKTGSKGAAPKCTGMALAAAGVAAGVIAAM